MLSVSIGEIVSHKIRAQITWLPGVTVSQFCSSPSFCVFAYPSFQISISHLSVSLGSFIVKIKWTSFRDHERAWSHWELCQHHGCKIFWPSSTAVWHLSKQSSFVEVLGWHGAEIVTHTVSQTMYETWAWLWICGPWTGFSVSQLWSWSPWRSDLDNHSVKRTVSQVFQLKFQHLFI